MTPRDALRVAGCGAVSFLIIATTWYAKGRADERNRQESLQVVDNAYQRLDDLAEPEPA